MDASQTGSSGNRSGNDVSPIGSSGNRSGTGGHEEGEDVGFGEDSTGGGERRSNGGTSTGGGGAWGGLLSNFAAGAFLVFHGHPTQIGGTSWSAPVWAAFCALMNEARKKAGKPALGFLNPLIYPLMGTPAFRDCASGSNGAFHCGPGYDMVTGIGPPNVKELIARIP